MNGTWNCWTLTSVCDGFTAGFYHLISHAIFKASLFMAAGSLIHVVGSRFMSDMGDCENT